MGHVVVAEKHRLAAREHDPRADGVVAPLVGDDEVTPLGESGDGAHGRARGIGVHDGERVPQELRDVLLEIDVRVNRAVEPPRAAAAWGEVPEVVPDLGLQFSVPKKVPVR